MNKFISFLIGGLLTTSVFAGTIEAPVIVQSLLPNRAVIQLHDVEGPCVNGAKLATWVSPNSQEKINGCWKTDGTVLQVAWFDGDPTMVPMEVFMKYKIKPNS